MTRVDAATRYRADVLSTQFAYDDTVAVYRRALRRIFLRLAVELLDDPTSGMGDDDLASLARLACQLVPDDENALIQASAEGRLDVVKLLVSRGADVNARVFVDSTFEKPDGEWRSPLSMARRGRHAEVVTFLQSAGARE